MTQSTTLKLPGIPLHLGMPVNVYRQNLVSQLLLPVRLLVWAALAVFFGWAAFTVLDNANWNVASRVLNTLFILMMVLGFIGWITFTAARKLGQLLLGWRDIAVEYADGIAYCHLGTWRDLRWEEITEVRRREWSTRWSDWGNVSDVSELVFVPLMMFLLGHMRDYTIGGERTGPIRICGTLKDATELMDTIQERTFKNRKQQAVKALQGGADVSFGKIAVHIDKGVRKGGKWRAWGEISAGDSYIAIKPAQGLIRLTSKITTDRLPNGDILWHLVSGRRMWLSSESLPEG